MFLLTLVWCTNNVSYFVYLCRFVDIYITFWVIHASNPPTVSLVTSPLAQNGTQRHLIMYATKGQHSPSATISVEPSTAYSLTNPTVRTTPNTMLQDKLSLFNVILLVWSKRMQMVLSGATYSPSSLCWSLPLWESNPQRCKRHAIQLSYTGP